MIDFVNGAVPDANFLVPGVKKVYAHPGILNEMLRQNQLDFAAVSAFEALENQKDYLICPKICIAAHQRVESVFLFTHSDLLSLHKAPVFLSGASKTSVTLIKIILERFLNISPCFVQQAANQAFLEDWESIRKNYAGAVFIGDWAQKAVHELGMKAHDLAELWYSHTDLSFVFALWAIRRDYFVKNPEFSRLVAKNLIQSVDRGLNMLPDLYKRKKWHLSEPQFIRFLSEVMRYRLQDPELLGLKRFCEELFQHGLLADPNLPEFFSLNA